MVGVKAEEGILGVSLPQTEPVRPCCQPPRPPPRAQTWKLESGTLEIMYKNTVSMNKPIGLPWWSSGLDSTLPLQGARVPFLVGEDPTCLAVRPKTKTKQTKNYGQAYCSILSRGVLALIRFSKGSMTLKG